MTGLKLIIELDQQTVDGLLRMSRTMSANGRKLGPNDWIVRILREAVWDFEEIEKENASEQKLIDSYEKSEKDCLWEGQSMDPIDYAYKSGMMISTILAIKGCIAFENPEYAVECIGKYIDLLERNLEAKGWKLE